MYHCLTSDDSIAGNVIVFIDEVHTLIGSGTVGRGNKGSGLDIANLLKPPLGRGGLQVGHSFSCILYNVLLYRIVVWIVYGLL